MFFRFSKGRCWAFRRSRKSWRTAFVGRQRPTDSRQTCSYGRRKTKIGEVRLSKLRNGWGRNFSLRLCGTRITRSTGGLFTRRTGFFRSTSFCQTVFSLRRCLFRRFRVCLPCCSSSFFQRWHFMRRKNFRFRTGSRRSRRIRSRDSRTVWRSLRRSRCLS